MPPRLLAVLALFVALLGLPAWAAAPAAPLTVLAASSLTEVLQRVATRWQAKGNGAVTFSFDASSRLAKQVEGGAPADVFVSADQEWMGWLEKRGLVDGRVTLAGNTLVAVVRADATTSPADTKALANPAIQRLAMAGENVPAGRYGRAALQSLGAWEAVKGRVIHGDNVRAALTWVATGEADAGIVYATDALVEPRVRVAFTFPSSSHPPITYPAAVVRSSPHAADARAFLDFCRSAEARALFAAAGFTPPPG